MATADTKPEPTVVKEQVSADPNFAVVCAFIKQFGTFCGVLCPSISRLQVKLITKVNIDKKLIPTNSLSGTN
jgi:hypothetical protein